MSKARANVLVPLLQEEPRIKDEAAMAILQEAIPGHDDDTGHVRWHRRLIEREEDLSRFDRPQAPRKVGTFIVTADGAVWDKDLLQVVGVRIFGNTVVNPIDGPVECNDDKALQAALKQAMTACDVFEAEEAKRLEAEAKAQAKAEAEAEAAKQAAEEPEQKEAA